MKLFKFLALISVLAVGAWLGYSQGLFSSNTSASPASSGLTADWADEFGAKADAKTASETTRLTVRSADFGDEECQEIAEFTGLTRLDLSNSGISDKALEEIAKLPKLETLVLDQTAITPAGLGQLAAADNLKELSLVGCPLNTNSAKSGTGIGELTSLETLNLMQAGVTDELVEQLASLSNLKLLYLGRTEISSNALKYLTKCKRLTTLNIAGIRMSDPGDFASLGSLPALELLYLDFSEFDDAAFAAFSKRCVESNSKIVAVFLEGCDITDASESVIAEFSALPSLAKLRLTRTQISRSVYDQLVAQAPDVSFAFGSSGQGED